MSGARWVGGFVRTVAGDVDPASLGMCGAHEHVYIGDCYASRRYPEFLLNDEARIVAELTRLKTAGTDWLIDSMPCGAGRDPEAMLRLSQASGVHLVAATGLHLAKYYPDTHWSTRYTVTDLVRLFSEDVMVGVDSHDYNGPMVDQTAIKAGVIKLAAPANFEERNIAAFEAGVLVHQMTGAPILTHTEEGQMALEQARYFGDAGADVSQIVLSHLDRNPDPEYHREVLRTGINIEYDSHFRWKGQGENPSLKLLVELLPEFPDQIVLGMDAARSAYWSSYGGQPGLDWLALSFRQQMLDAGLSKDLVQRAFVSTPRRAYSFGPLNVDFGDVGYFSSRSVNIEDGEARDEVETVATFEETS